MNNLMIPPHKTPEWRKDSEQLDCYTNGHCEDKANTQGLGTVPEAPNYSGLLTWIDLDEEEHSTTINLVAVSEETVSC